MTFDVVDVSDNPQNGLVAVAHSVAELRSVIASLVSNERRMGKYVVGFTSPREGHLSAIEVWSVDKTWTEMFLVVINSTGGKTWLPISWIKETT